MFYLYNILQLLLLPIFSPFILLFILLSNKYRDRIPSRLGRGLAENLPVNTKKAHPTIWLHALSVGEITSAVPLINGLRRQHPGCKIVVSVTTRSGRQVGDKILADLVDVVINGPIDLLPVIHYFYKHIQPDVFILVETDFWPNSLLYLKKKKVPTFLVNGRVSTKSMDGYKRFGFFFLPMFKSFSALCMQTEEDKEKMHSLGVEIQKIHTLGNLKFDSRTSFDTSIATSIQKQIPDGRVVFICGSTHPGEEQIIIESYQSLLKHHPELFLILAPRDPHRAKEISQMANALDFQVCIRTGKVQKDCQIFILDTIGELISCYFLGDIAFVGGSLVNKGGHNPLEPASMSLPVLFGPDMADFSEIAIALKDCGGGICVRNSQEMTAIVSELLKSEQTRKERGALAHRFVEESQGVIGKHLELIDRLL